MSIFTIDRSLFDWPKFADAIGKSVEKPMAKFMNSFMKKPARKKP